MTRFLAAPVVGILLALAAPASAEGPASSSGHSYEEPDAAFDEPVPGAKRLEGRLLSPCCWDTTRQTLDIHGSPIANQLRREIRSRLRSGESADAIEADLVRRYSEKILAVPPGNPLREVGIGLAVLVILGAAGAGSLLVKWRRAAADARSAPTAPDGGARDEWDDKLDRELEDVE